MTLPLKRGTWNSSSSREEEEEEKRAGW